MPSAPQRPSSRRRPRPPRGRSSVRPPAEWRRPATVARSPASPGAAGPSPRGRSTTARGGPGSRPAARLRLYNAPEAVEVEDRPDPDVRVRLGDLLPLVAMAQRMNFIWLKDFLDDEVAVSHDLYEVMQAFRSNKPTSA